MSRRVYEIEDIAQLTLCGKIGRKIKPIQNSKLHIRLGLHPSPILKCVMLCSYVEHNLNYFFHLAW